MAYECMYSLLDRDFTSNINYGQFFRPVLEGLGDVNEIKLICNQLIIKLAMISPNAVSSYINDIADALRSLLEVKLKDNAVKQEVEAQEEVVRSVLRVMYVLQKQFASSSLAVGGGGSVVALASSASSSSNTTASVAPKFEKLLSDFVMGDSAQFRNEYEKQKPQVEQSISFHGTFQGGYASSGGGLGRQASYSKST